MGFGVWGLGFGVWGLGVGGWGLGAGGWGLGVGGWGLGVGGWGLGVGGWGLGVGSVLDSLILGKRGSRLQGLYAERGRSSAPVEEAGLREGAWADRSEL